MRGIILEPTSRAPASREVVGGIAGRVLVVHSFYSSQQSGCANRAVGQRLAALERAGYEARLWAQHTDRRELFRLHPLAAAAMAASGNRVATGSGSPS